MKTARVTRGTISLSISIHLPLSDASMLTKPVMAGKTGESRLIKIEIAGAVVHAERGVDLGFLTDVLRAVKAAA